MDDEATIARLREARALKERGILAQRIIELESALKIVREGLRARETDVRALRRTLQEIDVALAALLLEGTAANIIEALRKQIAEALDD